jgi:hypothetical protein
MRMRLKTFLPLLTLAGAALAVPAHAGVSWSIGINAPIAPGVRIGTVISHGHEPRFYASAPVVYAPPPPVVYASPVVVASPPVFAPAVVAAPVVYSPPAVVVASRPVYRGYRAPVVVRPVYGGPHRDWDHGHGGHGGYGPMGQTHAERVLR